VASLDFELSCGRWRTGGGNLLHGVEKELVKVLFFANTDWYLYKIG
jgi:hypothetical protein